jgi:hypothetical protein
MSRSILLALALVSVAAACSNSAATPSPSTTGPTSELFSGSLSAQGSSFYSFNATQAGTVTLLLASVTSIGRATSPVILGLAFGIPMGTGCTHDQSLETPATLVPQISIGTTSGVHCVDVYDVGNLTNPVSFTVRIVHP